MTLLLPAFVGVIWDRSVLHAVMSKSVRPKDLTDKRTFIRTDKKISAAYFIVRTDNIFKISPNDWHVQIDFDISVHCIRPSVCPFVTLCFCMYLLLHRSQAVI